MSEGSPIQPVQPPAGAELLGKKSAGKVSGPSFGDVLKNSILEVNELQKDADFAIEQLQTGKTEKVSEVLTAVEKADLAFRALMQIRNKLVDAYEEVSRLRV